MSGLGWPGGARLLLIDPSEEVLDNVRGALADQPLAIDHAASVAAAKALLAKVSYDAVLLEGGLADADGLSLIREVDAPVLLASLPENYELIMSAYTAGAADFFCRSVSEVELVTRLQHLLYKRRGQMKVLRSGAIELDLDQRQWMKDGRSTHLTRHEAAFLAALLEAPRHFCTYGQLIEKVWGSAKAVETQNLRVLAGQIRRKIETDPNKARLLLTVTGVGYKLDAAADGKAETFTPDA